MSKDFGWDAANSLSYYSVLTLHPKYQPAEVGSYTFQLKTCLRYYSTVCFATIVSAEVNDCVITSLKVVQAPSKVNLTNQNYALSSNTLFNYQLFANQTPVCNYTSSGWTVASGSPISGNSPGEYLNLNPSTGLYSILPGRSRDGVGYYTIIITGVTLSG